MSWIVNDGKTWSEGESKSVENKPYLEANVYVPEETIFGVNLVHTFDKFTFDYKIYGVESKFIDRVVKTYQNTKENLGILLNGYKGTGKTVTAKQICNKLNLPVIILKVTTKSVIDFINSINQDIIIFVDEYEKIFQDNSSLLTVMDGVESSEFRRVFIFTTNSLGIDTNLIDRPSRIRYMKSYRNIEPSTIKEVVDDLLIHKEHEIETINYITSLYLITIDIIKAVIMEVNIHNESPSNFEDVFNAEKISNRFKVTLFQDSASVVLMDQVTLNAIPKNYRVRNSVYINGVYFGQITKILGNDQFEILVKFNVDDYGDMIDDEDEDVNEAIITVKFEQTVGVNSAFMGDNTFDGKIDKKKVSLDQEFVAFLRKINPSFSDYDLKENAKMTEYSDEDSEDDF
jgi:SpoVK/Ycf46/Vps4 family AAA+-type ATPase